MVNFVKIKGLKTCWADSGLTSTEHKRLVLQVKLFLSGFTFPIQKFLNKLIDLKSKQYFMIE